MSELLRGGREAVSARMAVTCRVADDVGTTIRPCVWLLFGSTSRLFLDALDVPRSRRPTQTVQHVVRKLVSLSEQSSSSLSKQYHGNAAHSAVYQNLFGFCQSPDPAFPNPPNAPALPSPPLRPSSFLRSYAFQPNHPPPHTAANRKSLMNENENPTVEL